MSSKYSYGLFDPDTKILQTRLIKLGVLSPKNVEGDPNDDGIFGTETTKAIISYQKNHGISPASGRVDERTENSLGLGPAGDTTVVMKGIDMFKWLSTPVALTLVKYVVAAVAQYLAVKFGLDQASLAGILLQIVTVIMAAWGVTASAEQKLVVDGQKVPVAAMTATEKQTVKAIADKHAA